MRNESKDNYTVMLRVTRVIGSSTLISMSLNMVRMKVAAVLLGPAGVGFFGLLQSFVLTVSSIISFGISQSAARQVAESVSQGEKKEKVTQRAITSLSLILVIVGSIILFAAQDLIEPFIVVSYQYAFEYFWLVLAIAALTLSGAFHAQLSGYRKIKQIALVNIISAALSLVVGVFSLVFLENRGFLVFFVSFFFIKFVVTAYYVRLIYVYSPAVASLRDILGQHRVLLKIGAAIMIGSVSWNLAHILVKKYVEAEINLAEVGILEAGWTLGTVYLGFLLASIGADYLPRLTAVVKEQRKAVDVINHQTEMLFLFAGPIIIFTMGFSPWIVPLLYSASFQQASDLLRLFVLGDVLKLLAWPLTYALLAVGSSNGFLLIELISVFVYIVVNYIFVGKFGATAAGLSIVFIYAATLPLCYIILNKRLKFRWSGFSVGLFVVVFLLTFAIYVIGFYSFKWAAICSVLFSLSASVYSFYVIKIRVDERVASR